MKTYNNIKIAIAIVLNVVLSCIVSFAVSSRNSNPQDNFMFYEEVSKRTLTTEQADSIISIIGTEGFDYAFRHYSSYRDVNDTNFHNLRKNYIDAAADLLSYIQESSSKNEIHPQ